MHQVLRVSLCWIGLALCLGAAASSAAQPLRPHIEQIIADGTPVRVSSGRAFVPSGTGHLVFLFGTTPTTTEAVHFRYRLEGVDAGWVEAGTRREASYEHLTPGRYTFLIDVAGADGTWTGLPATVVFDVSSPVTQSPLFVFAFALVFGLASFALYRVRLRHLHARQRELLRLVEEHTQSLRAEKEKTERALAETEEARREAERQREIAQEARAVIEAQAERLREMDQIKTRFFSNISHEFRTPLTLTIGPLENALTGVYGPVGPALRKQLELMLRNARRLLRLINQLLDLSKLDSGRMTLSARRGDIVPLLEGVVLSFTAFAEEKDLHLSFTPESDEILLDFDPGCLEKVFFNLVSNAVKFTPPGGRIEVSVRRTDEDGSTGDAVEIRVADTGIGISAEKLPHLFDRFYQVDGAVAHAGEGTGIGLALVRELVVLHGGTIHVDSSPGAGSVFTVVLPTILQGAAPPETWESPLPGATTRGALVEMAVFDDAPLDDAPLDEPDAIDAMPAGAFGPDASLFRLDGGDGFTLDAHPLAPLTVSQPGDVARPTILVVDDNPDVCAYVAGILERLCRVVTAGDGREALAKAREIMPDLVLTDVMMPHMDGYALCRALRADERLRFVPVILLTARASIEDRLAGFDAGATDYVDKPFNAAELVARVRNLLTLRRQQQALQRLNADLAEKNASLAELSEMKSHLLHLAAHDIKNPLSSIREFARLLQHEVGPGSPILDPLKLIYQSADQMLRVVTTLLDSAAIESGRLPLHRQPTCLAELATEVVQQNRLPAERKGQQIHLDVPEEPCEVMADRDRLFEAMDNLVNNAIKYSPARKPIRVRLQRTPKAFRFEVRDEGPGLTEADRRKLFRQFQRLSAQPTGGESSSGLGLAIVKQLIELHGGQVLVESTVGRGSTFILELPTSDLPVSTDAG